MQMNFERTFTRVRESELGYSNNPKDNGGSTMNGVTQRVFNEYLAASGQKPYSVKLITLAQERAIFNVKYWIACKADRLMDGWDYAIVDFGYNSGPSRATRLAQTILGLEPDGVIGPITIAAINKAPVEKLNEFNDRRLAYLKTLDDWPEFKNGWTTRVAKVKKLSAADLLKARPA